MLAIANKDTYEQGKGTANWEFSGALPVSLINDGEYLKYKPTIYGSKDSILSYRTRLEERPAHKSVQFLLGLSGSNKVVFVVESGAETAAQYLKQWLWSSGFLVKDYRIQ